MSESASKKKKGKFPVDIKKLRGAVSELEQEQELELNIDLLIDATASEELAQVVTRAFESGASNVNLTPMFFADEAPAIETPSDLCIVVAGTSVLVGDIASAARATGIPAVVVCEASEGAFTEDPACLPPQAQGHKPVPGADLVEVDLEASPEHRLDALGDWIVNFAPAKRIAMAKVFPFIRYPLCRELIYGVAARNASVAILVFIPGADMPVITYNQTKLVLQIASAYGNELDGNRIKELAMVVGGAFGFRAVARELSTLIPGIGFGVKAGIAYSGTLAVGMTALDYFQGGGHVAQLGKRINELTEGQAGVVAQRVNEMLASAPL